MIHTPSILLIVVVLVLLFGWGGGGYYGRSYYGPRGYGIGWIIVVVLVIWLLFARPF